jgi:hypothetical protein
MKHRTLITAVISTVAVVAGSAAAFADDIVIDGDTLTPITTNGEPLSFGAVPCNVPTTKAVTIAIKRQGGAASGKVFEGGAADPVSVSVTSVSGPLSATLPTPNGIVLPDAWEDISGTPTLSQQTVTGQVTVTPTFAGSGSGTVTLSGSGRADSSMVTLKVDGTLNVTWNAGSCAPTNQAPSVSVIGVAGGASYELGKVPDAVCSVLDAEDGNSTFPATLSPISGPLAEYGIGDQTATCEYTDEGGLTGTATATYSVKDTTPPTMTFSSVSPKANESGWNNSPVTVTWTCWDLGGVVSETVSRTTEAEGGDLSVEGTCEDESGNTTTSKQTGINIDLTDPEVQLVGGPTDGASYYFGQVPAAPTCEASDALSGLDGACSVEGYSTSVGSHSITASAKDNAGNSVEKSVSYTVKAWTVTGFYQPVDVKGTLNTVKGGSTVPLKFEVFAGGTELTETSVVTGFTAKPIFCDSSAPTDEIEFLSTGGTQLRYDTVADQFVQNWQTPRKPGSCYRVTMTTQDGSTISADFKLK